MDYGLDKGHLNQEVISLSYMYTSFAAYWIHFCIIVSITHIHPEQFYGTINLLILLMFTKDIQHIGLQSTKNSYKVKH